MKTAISNCRIGTTGIKKKKMGADVPPRLMSRRDWSRVERLQGASCQHWKNCRNLKKNYSFNVTSLWRDFFSRWKIKVYFIFCIIVHVTYNLTKQREIFIKELNLTENLWDLMEISVDKINENFTRQRYAFGSHCILSNNCRCLFRKFKK